jgi:uncharacterized protein YcsI (UPF0317 family)
VDYGDAQVVREGDVPVFWVCLSSFSLPWIQKKFAS